MWLLICIRAKNIAAFRELDYTLRQNVTTLVFGNNLDNDSQGSNGSGKSALLEAISISLTGETLRKVKADEIINDAADEAFVEAVFRNSLTGEDFVVSRTLSRKAPQQIECHIFRDGKEMNVEETKQPSVSDYNRYVLDKIGLTKEDVFNNFILSKHKYSCFLSNPDRDKKEIINRFSNAVIVDEAIAALEADLVPEEEKLRQAELNVSKIEGCISAIGEQIVQAKDSVANEKNSKVRRKEELEQAIVQQRERIGLANKIIGDHRATLAILDETYNEVIKAEQDDSLSMKQAYRSIETIFRKRNIAGFENWEEKSGMLSSELQAAQDLQADIERRVKSALESTDAAQEVLERMRKEYFHFEVSHTKESERLKAVLDEVRNKTIIVENELLGIQNRQRQTRTEIGRLKNSIAGEIVCPRCSHSFVLGQNFDIDATKEQISLLEKEETRLLGEKEEKVQEIDQLNKKEKGVLSQQKELTAAYEKEAAGLQEQSEKVNRLYRSYQSLNRELDTCNGQVRHIETTLNTMVGDMFDSAFNLVDRLTKETESGMQQEKIVVSTSEGSIATYEKSIRDLDAVDDCSLLSKLEASLKSYEIQRVKAVKIKEEAESRVRVLKGQGHYFVEFKTHLANSKIEALGQITNEFLERIGSDIRIRFSGYTVLKSGKVRDKISISIVRNGIDCGSFDKFSEGEKARVNLANILAMHKLTNVGCEDGKGLDLLILDEILEATDETGLASIFEALNSLQMTALVVSHGNVAENYPYKLIVNKENGVSFLNV